MKNIIFIIISLILIGISLYKCFDLNNESEVKSKKINLLETEKITLTNKISELEKNSKEESFTITNFNFHEEMDKLKAEKNLLEKEIKTIKESKIEFKLIKEFKVKNLNIGEWTLTETEKNEIINSFDKTKSFYEITPIVDKNKYQNDKDELKQLGLSRKRAATAVTLLRSLNPNNKIYLSTEIIYSEDERGFIISQYN